MPYSRGNQNFQQGAFVKPPAGSPDAATGWVYSYGTPSGRAGTVYLSRVNEYADARPDQVPVLDGTAWVVELPSAAKPICRVRDHDGLFGFGRTTTFPSVSEMSVQYNAYLEQSS